MQRGFRFMDWIGTDGSNFYFREHAEGNDAKNWFYKCPIENNNRMSFNSSKILKPGKARRSFMLHNRIRKYFKMFTSFMNFETFLVVAFRDRLMQIDLTNEPE